MAVFQYAHRARALLVALALGGWVGCAVWAAAPAAAGLADSGCLSCHDDKARAIQVPVAEGQRPLLGVARGLYAQGVHGRMTCVQCHTRITDSPRRGRGHKASPRPSSVGCAECHQRLWDAARADATAAARPGLGKVVENTEAWRTSFHARSNSMSASGVNADCDGCHDTHSFAIPAPGSPAQAPWRQGSTALCSASCHADEIEEYRQSTHGEALIEKGNAKSATCFDCHGAHAIGKATAAPVKLAITARCGSCHKREDKSYKATYHGQIGALGYAYTAKCFDCHGAHDILPAPDPDSRVHASRRMRTCRTCHNGKKGLAVAPASFATFQPHARTDDFAHFPQLWIGYRAIVGVLLGTFGFFWAHTALWFWREFQDRRLGRTRPHVLAAALPAAAPARQVRRFGPGWRLAHLVFALSLMLLTLTGMPLFYPEAAWAPPMMKALGGPKVAGLIHRGSAVVMLVIFVGHFAALAWSLWRRRGTFRWLGPDSLVPNLQDLRDIAAMFRWFVGRGPRPQFDRWTYWEKFDYWAPFWGVAVLAGSGLVLWFPDIAGPHLPGWVFNLAAVFHGEEAFLAVVFLFTVHFFNNHFRPDKYPLDIVMFTGTMSLPQFQREHPLQYRRLQASGELERYLVDAPSAPMTWASRVLGATLIVAGLALLAGVAAGFFGGGH